jgi:hypothetical protein
MGFSSPAHCEENNGLIAGYAKDEREFLSP